jgi:hypothetical protein
MAGSWRTLQRELQFTVPARGILPAEGRQEHDESRATICLQGLGVFQERPPLPLQ